MFRKTSCNSPYYARSFKNGTGAWKTSYPGPRTCAGHVEREDDMDFNTPAENVKLIDLYSKNTIVKDYYLGSTTLKKGKHTIRFESAGQNDNSKGNYLGFDSFRLRERWLKKRASLK